MKDFSDDFFFSDLEIRHGAYLPHWFKPGAIYAVTFRLTDSLPASVLASWDQESLEIQTRARIQGRSLTEHENQKINQSRSRQTSDYLDQGRGSCHLKDPRIAQVVADAIGFFENKRYQLHAWCIMPNHVHVVLEPKPDQHLSDTLKSWKSFSAKEANRILKRTGPFWQRESYDHIIRDLKEYDHALEYVRNNPIKAGLKDWPWVWVRPLDPSI